MNGMNEENLNRKISLFEGKRDTIRDLLFDCINFSLQESFLGARLRAEGCDLDKKNYQIDRTGGRAPMWDKITHLPTGIVL